MKTRNFLLLIIIAIICVVFSGCSSGNTGMNNGYYSAEAESFDSHGWKEYITIYVSGNSIITVEYDARNASGFIKSWDMEYMRVMTALHGTYPNEYARSYATSLLNWQNPDNVDAVSGATESYSAFQLLAKAAVSQAKAGDKRVALVEIPEVA